jgi:hypothetical protein
MPTTDKEAMLRALWRDKMHVEPRALELAPAAVRRSYEHPFQPTELVLHELRAFPHGLLRLWWLCPRGHAVFTHRPSRYAPGPQPWRDGTLTSVAYVSIVDLCPQYSGADPLAAWRALLELIDHLLGGACDESRPRFSQGAGITPTLAEAARRFSVIAGLGYAAEPLGTSDASDYLVQTLWLYLQDPRRLNVLDPLAYKLYHDTLLAESFWAGQCPIRG